MAAATVSLEMRADGSVVLPKELRAKWHLKSGDVVEICAPEPKPIWETMSRADYMRGIAEMQHEMAPFAPKSGEKLLSEELIEERKVRSASRA